MRIKIGQLFVEYSHGNDVLTWYRYQSAFVRATHLGYWEMCFNQGTKKEFNTDFDPSDAVGILKEWRHGSKNLP